MHVSASSAQIIKREKPPRSQRLRQNEDEMECGLLNGMLQQPQGLGYNQGHPERSSLTVGL